MLNKTVQSVVVDAGRTDYENPLSGAAVEKSISLGVHFVSYQILD